MSDNLGPIVSRSLDPTATQYDVVIWEAGKPPLDSELNLLQQLASDWRRSLVLRGTPSGWLGQETNTKQAFVTSPAWSNQFRYGRQRTTPGGAELQAIQWAVVNGWLIPVTGTKTGNPPGAADNTTTQNVITLDPPPGNSGDFRTDFVFLEVWKARIPPNPLATNKPSATGIYRYGNVEGGFSFIPDDLVDPALGFETTERTQLQYRLRVVTGLVNITGYPDGFDPNTVKAQGAATSPTSWTFENMRVKMGDPGLWRAGDGTANALGTVDGYVYAIPLCGVFRRNGVLWTGDPSANLNGALNRNPTAVDRTGVKTFVPSVTLAADMTSTQVTASLSALPVTVPPTYYPMPMTSVTPVAVQIGDEIITYQAITGTTMSSIVRGAYGTVAEEHPAGTPVKVLSTRPDGLFADQIALTDILDLRHVVSPNGFDYQALLESNLDKLLKGEMRANWKRTGASQGVFLSYQDKVSGGATSINVTKLDAPDNLRQVYSDAATLQPVEFVLTPATAGPYPAPANVAWSLDFTANQNSPQSVAGEFNPTDTLVIPIGQMKASVGSDTDQVRLLNEIQATGTTGSTTGTDPFLTDNSGDFSGVSVGDTLCIFDGAAAGTYTVTAVQSTTAITVDATLAADTGIDYEVRFGPGQVVMRVDGESALVPQHAYRMTPQNPTPNDDLTITLQSAFPTVAASTNGIQGQVYLTAYLQYGPGRGLSRRPDSLHSVAMLNPGVEVLSQPQGLPTGNVPMRVAWAPLWSKYRNAPFAGALPVTAEAYADPGSKTLILTPFRRIEWVPDFRTMDGTGINVTTTDFLTGTLGSSVGTTTFTDATKNFGTAGVTAGMTLHYYGQAWNVVTVGTTTLTVDRALPTAGPLAYSIDLAQGLMPLKKLDGTTAKWSITDPLALFANQATGANNNAHQKNLYVTLPRDMVPGWGAVHVPILPGNAPSGTFHRGINFGFISKSGPVPAAVPSVEKNYIAYTNGPSVSHAIFSTVSSVSPLTPATYNTAFTLLSLPTAGLRFFNDTPDPSRPTARGLGRKGLELPPFYGIARLFAVYEAADYVANESSFDPQTREYIGGQATNLLRQNVNGPTFWIEIDDDGDSTFILNADCIDISKSPNAIANFESGNYVIEANVFGFDRGAFDLAKEFRVVLTRERTELNSNSDRTKNVGLDQSIPLQGPVSVLPGPAPTAEEVVINYSRTPYQGDAWGQQTNYNDLGYFPGPMSSAAAYQLVSTRLDEENLTRPEQKVLEVLASVGFSTTLGTGHIAGDIPSDPQVALLLGALDFRNAGYEDPASFPPASNVADRPVTLMGPSGLILSPLSTQYLGCTERLPLGALWRDKDFRGDLLSGSNFTPFIYYGENTGAGGLSTTLARMTSLEQDEILLDTAEMATGTPGELIVHVKGEQTNYTQLVNFRTFRGGSAFTASGAHPGGEVGSVYGGAPLARNLGHSNVLTGQAYLVRNAPTTSTMTSTEVSAGDELMLLVVTTGYARKGMGASPPFTLISTSGAGEGLSAADLYRIEGHPLVRNNVRIDLDPSTITLSHNSQVLTP